MAYDPAALPDEVQVFLQERHLATLTTLRPDGSPHVVAVGFTWDDDAGLARVITFAPSRKARRAGGGGRGRPPIRRPLPHAGRARRPGGHRDHRRSGAGPGVTGDAEADGTGSAASAPRRRVRRLAGAAAGAAAVAVVALALVAGSSEPVTTTAGPLPGSTSSTVPAPSSSSSSSSPATQPSTTADPPAPGATQPPVTLTDPWWAYKGNLDGPRVVVVGDSITAEAQEEIAGALQPDFATQVIGLMPA